MYGNKYCSEVMYGNEAIYGNEVIFGSEVMYGNEEMYGYGVMYGNDVMCGIETMSLDIQGQLCKSVVCYMYRTIHCIYLEEIQSTLVILTAYLEQPL